MLSQTDIDNIAECLNKVDITTAEDVKSILYYVVCGIPDTISDDEIVSAVKDAIKPFN